MKEKKVIAWRNIPTAFHLISLFMLYTALHYWSVPNWVMIIFYVYSAFRIILSVINMSSERQIDIFSKKGTKKLTFKEKIEEKMNQ